MSRRMDGSSWLLMLCAAVFVAMIVKDALPKPEGNVAFRVESPFADICFDFYSASDAATVTSEAGRMVARVEGMKVIGVSDANCFVLKREPR